MGNNFNRSYCPFSQESYWHRLLWDRAITMFKWDGFDDNINPDFVESVTQSQGYSIAVEKNGKMWILQGAVLGYDPQGYPTDFIVNNAVLGEISGKLGKDGVLLLNTPYGESTKPIIRKYGVILEEVDSDLKVNLFNVKTSRIFPVKNEGQAQKIRRMLDTMTESAVPSYIVDSSLTSTIEDSKPIMSPVDFLGRELSESKLLILNEFYSTFGYNCTQIIKRERVTDDEVQSNNQQIELNKQMWLRPREKFCKEVKRVFDRDISVGLNEEVRIDEKPLPMATSTSAD